MKRTAPIALLSLALTVSAAQAQLPKGYPADYQSIIDAAKNEKSLIIYGATDKSSAQYLLDDFKKLYPDINVEYNDLGTSAINSRFIAENAAKRPSADLVWSSAMDLQVQLAANGNALTYKSPEIKGLPAWANYKDQAYGTSLEPMVLVYNKRLVKPEDVPQTRADFAKMVAANPSAFNRKIAAFDPIQSGFGYTVMSNDAKQIPGFWDTMDTLGKANLTTYSSSGVQLEKVNAGEHLYDYSLSGSYVLDRMRKLKDLGYSFYKDGTTAFSRVAFINKNAQHPNAAKLFLDYLLSTRGQTIAANRGFIFAIKPEIAGIASYRNLVKEAGGADKIKYIPVSEELLKDLDPKTRNAFFERWRKALGQ